MKRKWEGVPTWKRRVLERREFESSAPSRRRAAEDQYWTQRAAELLASGLAPFQMEVVVKREKQEVASGRRRLPPEVLDLDGQGPAAPAAQRPATAARAAPPLERAVFPVSTGIPLPPPPPV